MLLIALGIAAGAAVTGIEVKAARPVPAPVTGRVVFVGPVPADSGGSVRLEGQPPASEPIPIDATKSEGCVHGGTVDDTDRSLLVGEGGGLANVVVTVEVEGVVVKAPDEPFRLDQKGCRFEPHVAVVRAGRTVEWLNSDGVSHNVHTRAFRNDSFNLNLASGSSHGQKLERAERIEITCDIHPWMRSWLIVTEAPYFAVTDAGGNFTLPGLPAGTHKIEYWHEKLGRKKGAITVGDDGSGEAVALKWGLEDAKRRRPRRH